MMSNHTTPSSYGPPPTITKLELAPPLLSFISDTLLSVITPVVIYWVVSIIFHYMDTYDVLPKYRIHTPEEVTKRNHVSRSEVIREVIIQQVLQSIVGFALGWSEPPEMTGGEDLEVWRLSQRVGWVFKTVMATVGIDSVGVESKFADSSLNGLDWRWKVAEALYWVAFPLLRLALAIFVLDTWQYFVHRAMHQVPFLYRTLHSRHHRLYVPYAFGALYNHPVEGLFMDTIGAGLAYKVSGMTLKGSIFFFGFSTMKTVDDHCGYKLPYDPLQLIFYNNAEYHDIHHQGWGIKNNFSQPFLICWDRWLGTQYTGTDAAARNERTKLRVQKQVENEKLRKEASITSAAEIDEYAARRVVPEEDDVEYIKVSAPEPSLVSATPLETVEAAAIPQKRKVRSTRKMSLLDGNMSVDVSVKDVAESLKDTGKWVNGVVGNVSGAKMR